MPMEITCQCVVCGQCAMMISDIELLPTYKTDNFTVDTIWVQFTSKKETFHLHEEVQGFYETVHALVALLPGAKKDWYDIVVQPPFEENYTVIYRREPIEVNDGFVGLRS